VLKLPQKIVNGIYNMTMSSWFLSWPKALQCQACGNIPETLITIMIGNKQWFVCDTDKCKRKILSEQIIQLV
jgi:hypothetical protein